MTGESVWHTQGSGKSLTMLFRDITTRLFISEHAVEAHVANMLNKLGLNSGIQLTRGGRVARV